MHRYRVLLFNTQAFVNVKLSELTDASLSISYPFTQFCARVLSVNFFRLPGIGQSIINAVALSPPQLKEFIEELKAEGFAFPPSRDIFPLPTATTTTTTTTPAQLNGEATVTGNGIECHANGVNDGTTNGGQIVPPQQQQDSSEKEQSEEPNGDTAAPTNDEKAEGKYPEKGKEKEEMPQLEDPGKNGENDSREINPIYPFAWYLSHNGNPTNKVYHTQVLLAIRIFL